MESCVQLPLDEKQLQDLVEKAKDYLLMHGKSLIKSIFKVRLPKF